MQAQPRPPVRDCLAANFWALLLGSVFWFCFWGISKSEKRVVPPLTYHVAGVTGDFDHSKITKPVLCREVTASCDWWFPESRENAFPACIDWIQAYQSSGRVQHMMAKCISSSSPGRLQTVCRKKFPQVGLCRGRFGHTEFLNG